MRIRLGWINEDSDFIDNGKYYVINLRFFMDKGVDDFCDLLKSLCARLSKDVAVVFAYDLLYAEIRECYRSRLKFTLFENEKLLDLIVLFVRYYRESGREIIKTLGLEGRNALGATEVFEWQNMLYSRYGIVELRAAYTYLYEPELNKVVYELDDLILIDSLMYKGAFNKGNWLSPRDSSYNLRRLMTNAGFYHTRDLIHEFKSWSICYIEALNSSGAYFVCPNAYPNFLILETQLDEESLTTPYVKFPPPQAFFNSLRSKSVLFLTPFSEQINDHYKNNNFINLYKDIDVPDFEIKAIPGFITTYPNQPHLGWTDTFRKMCESVDEEMKKVQYDIFFASCGCYGLPLCNYVHKKYGIPSVYHGNLLNTYLGVSMKSNVNFMKEGRNELYWKKSNLSQIPNVARIDGGRYS